MINGVPKLQVWVLFMIEVALPWRLFFAYGLLLRSTTDNTPVIVIGWNWKFVQANIALDKPDPPPDF